MFVVQNLQYGTPEKTNFIRRVEWGARPAPRKVNQKEPAKYVVLHHTLGDSSDIQTGNPSHVRYIQRQHIDIKGFTDIGYNFLVDEEGRVYEGRSWGVECDASQHYNKNGMLIALVGDFTEEVPSQEALEAVKTLVELGVGLGKIEPDYKLKVHKNTDQAGTEGPGDKFYEEVKSWPNFEE